MDGCSEIKHEIDNCNLYSNYEKGKVREKRQINKQIKKSCLQSLPDLSILRTKYAT